MRKLQRNRAFRLQNDLHAADKIVEIGNLGQYIVADQQIYFPVLLGKFTSSFAAKEFNDRRNPFLLSYRSNIGRRLNTYSPDPFLNEVLKKIAIVARQF